jgi:hypothetical protein
MLRPLWILLAVTLAYPSGIGAQSVFDLPDPDSQAPALVGVTVTTGAILLATRARPEQGLLGLGGQRDWRFRHVPVAPNVSVRSAALSPDGTVLIVTLGSGAVQHVDLKEEVLEIEDGASAGAPGAAQAEIAPLQPAEAPRGIDADARWYLASNGFAPDDTLESLTPPAWRFFLVAPPAPERYAPIFMLQGSEQVRPSAFDVWSQLSAPAGVSGEALERALFRSYRQRTPACSIHTRVQSYPGSWVIQYWLYYPFDRGFGGHLHDSEHIFVEVDKLGGSVRRIAGAGHGPWAPNSIYHTFSLDAAIVRLPLHALIELGKHATAPDVNRDGFFTPGMDSNVYWDAAKVWGVRDNTGSTDSSYRAFDGTMAVPRFQSVQMITVRGFERYHRGYLDEKGFTPELCAPVPLGALVTGTRCADPTGPCAEGHVRQNTDFRRPVSILKPGIYPRFFFRAGVAALPWQPEDPNEFQEQRPAMYVGYGLELQFPKFKLPGRVYGEAFFRNSKKQFDGLAFTYETLHSNLFGYYMGLSWFNDIEPFEDDDVEFSKGLWLTGGGLYEQMLPVPWPDFLGSGLNLNSRFGLSFDNSWGLNWEVRGGLGVTFGTPFRKFGIRASDPSPY